MTLQPYSHNDALAEKWKHVNQGPLTDSDYEALKDAMPTYRDLLIVKLLRCTGLRISELLSLTPSQKIHYGLSHAILVRRAKKRGNDPDQQYDPIFLPAELGMELDSYIKEHFRKPQEPIFQGNRQGQRLTTHAIDRIFRQISPQIGRKVTPHMLRSYYSTYLLRQGLPVEVASKLLGHADIKTTLAHYHDLTVDTRRQIGEAIRP